ncbi:MAG: hypothetical protein JST19_13675 [Bacteroidetes bacterium]|nr:hypothetical protein [Bacteroidota bacterium]
MKRLLYTMIITIVGSGIAYGQGNNKLQISAGYSHVIFSNFIGDAYKETLNIGTSTSNDTIGKKMSHQLNGLDITGAYRLSDHFAAKASFGWLTGSGADGNIPGGFFTRKSADPSSSGVAVPDYYYQHIKRSYLAFVGGVEYKDFKSAHRLIPFAHLMIGLSMESVSYNLSNIPHAIIYQSQNYKVHETPFTVDAGAGLDVKVNKDFDIRIIQVDFLPTFPTKKYIQKRGDLRGPFPGTSFSNEQLYSMQDVATDGSFQANFRFGIGLVFTPTL